MPKRLKAGRKVEQRFRGDCRGCGAEWEYLRSELRDIQFDQRESGDLCSVVCADCRQSFWVYPVTEKTP